jgi:hypothetical protein
VTQGPPGVSDRARGASIFCDGWLDWGRLVTQKPLSGLLATSSSLPGLDEATSRGTTNGVAYGQTTRETQQACVLALGSS